MYCFGDWRSATFCFSWFMRSRSRWRIFSRSTATERIRFCNGSANTSGIAKVSTVAAAATAASTIVCVWVLIAFSSRLSMAAAGFRSEIEVDHLLHHQHAARHPEGGGRQHQVAERVGEEQGDVVLAGDIDEQHHAERQRADDAGGGLRLLRHRADLGFHLLAVA